MKTRTTMLHVLSLMPFLLAVVPASFSAPPKTNIPGISAFSGQFQPQKPGVLGFVQPLYLSRYPYSRPQPSSQQPQIYPNNDYTQPLPDPFQPKPKQPYLPQPNNYYSLPYQPPQQQPGYYRPNPSAYQPSQKQRNYYQPNPYYSNRPSTFYYKPKTPGSQYTPEPAENYVDIYAKIDQLQKGYQYKASPKFQPKGSGQGQRCHPTKNPKCYGYLLACKCKTCPSYAPCRHFCC